ncbi:hypothetical protein HY638_05035 [Candidatus Woesearchaeota archaeon]|nr:hypothetical protein [Candidatus Woesearchaeota archaeon]
MHPSKDVVEVSQVKIPFSTSLYIPDVNGFIEITNLLKRPDDVLTANGIGFYPDFLPAHSNAIIDGAARATADFLRIRYAQFIEHREEDGYRTTRASVEEVGENLSVDARYIPAQSTGTAMISVKLGARLDCWKGDLLPKYRHKHLVDSIAMALAYASAPVPLKSTPSTIYELVLDAAHQAVGENLGQLEEVGIGNVVQDNKKYFAVGQFSSGALTSVHFVGARKIENVLWDIASHDISSAIRDLGIEGKVLVDNYPEGGYNRKEDMVPAIKLHPSPSDHNVRYWKLDSRPFELGDMAISVSEEKPRSPTFSFEIAKYLDVGPNGERWLEQMNYTVSSKPGFFIRRNDLERIERVFNKRFGLSVEGQSWNIVRCRVK